MGLVDRIKKIDGKQLFFLALIFLIGFGFRAHLLKYELFFEFDSYWHARMTEQIINNGTPFLLDPLSYYQLGGGPMAYSGVGWWYVTAAFYKVFSFPFTGGAYDKLLWIQFVKFLPAFFGALTGIAMFFLFKEIYGVRAGYLAGFFTAISSGYIYRTMAGFFEGSSLVFLVMVVGFFFLARAVKNLEFNKKTIGSAALAGLFIGLTGFIGGWYLVASYTILPFTVFGALVLWFRNKNALNFLKVCAITLVIVGGINFVFGLDFFVHDFVNQNYNEVHPLLHAHPPFDWLGGTFSYLKPYIGLSPNTVPTREEAEGDIGAVFRSSVGEQQSGFPAFGNKFNALLVFPVIALFLIPWRILRKKDDAVSLLLFFWVAASFAMAYFRLQMTFAFGLGLAVAAAFCFNEIIEFAQKRTPFEKMILCVGLLLFVFIGVAQAALFTDDQVPNIESEAGWKQALDWIKDNTPKDAKMFNWWDEGHWISFMGERKVLLDNRNIDLNGDSAVALAIVTTDVNQACGIIKSYGSDYAVFGGDLLEKEQSLALYGYKTLNPSNPNIQGFGAGVIMGCSKDAGVYHCGGNNLPEQQMNSISTKWNSTPTQFYDERTPMFVYRSEDNSYLYLILGARVNNSFLARAWFNDPAVYCLKNVYGNTVKVFKVI